MSKEKLGELNCSPQPHTEKNSDWLNGFPLSPCLGTKGGNEVCGFEMHSIPSILKQTQFLKD